LSAGGNASTPGHHRALTEPIALYRSAGYIDVGPFNDKPYADHWFEKRLDCKTTDLPPEAHRSAGRGESQRRAHGGSEA
jgi:hypothetical protein